MAEKTLSVYEALIEISRLNDKIEKFNSSSTMPLFLACATESAKYIEGMEKEKYINLLKSNYDSCRHLISNLSEYKAKVALSNALTTITVGGKEYTIAEAIQRKQNIDTEIRFLRMIETQLKDVNTKITAKNNTVKAGLTEYLEKVKSETATPEEIDKLTNIYNEKNLFILVDPYGITETIDEKRQELETFLSDVDTKITASNCSTMITVDLED